MQIQITAPTFVRGNVQFEHGQVLNLPDELAQQFLEDGVAEPAEIESVVASIAGFVPPSAKARKDPRRK